MPELSQELGGIILIAAALIYGILRRVLRRYVSVPIRRLLKDRLRKNYFRR